MTNFLCDVPEWDHTVPSSGDTCANNTTVFCLTNSFKGSGEKAVLYHVYSALPLSRFPSLLSYIVTNPVRTFSSLLFCANWFVFNLSPI